MKTAIDCKAYLLDLLNERDTETLLVNIDRICLALPLTLGLWVELGYAYKGVDITDRCIDECNRLLAACGHPRRFQRIARLRDRAREVGACFRLAQHEYLFGDTC